MPPAVDGSKRHYLIGIDVGSTTVKCVLVDASSLEITWSKYQRHDAQQAKKLAELLEEIASSNPHLNSNNCQAYITGSGAMPLAKKIGARFIQEVNAVTLAVEKLHPEVNSVIELGGQDAKIILFKESPNGERQVITSMNDKCASGTGATIDKCIQKVAMGDSELQQLNYDPQRLHHVAAKCGVFAETDIVNLIKSGIPANEVINSLADAIVMQNLSVLARGNTLRGRVLLLGGPNTYLPFLQQCWSYRIPQTWQEQGYQPQHDEASIIVPDNAQYYAAFGAVVFGMAETDKAVSYLGPSALTDLGSGTLNSSRPIGKPLVVNQQELETFNKNFTLPRFKAKQFADKKAIVGTIGLDGGSTSSKAVLLGDNGEVLFKAYQISSGNPIKDMKTLLGQIKDYALTQQCPLKIRGMGVTGYAGDVLNQSLQTDANIVETIAHMMSAKRFCGDDIDVICDIGGQDIKVLFLKNGAITNFRLSNQCSAGNGTLLQSMAQQFGVPMEEYAAYAFQAKQAPIFGYGCAVFLDSDRVTFQKEGYTREELFAGLAQVLPKNIWQYVVQIPRMAELGKKFVLQGGTQYNLAAVKAQLDYIKQRVPDADVIVHPHTGEAGAIGAALEAQRIVKQRGHSSFIGLDAAINLSYSSRTDETTRCYFCDNHCSRTFIDTQTPSGKTSRYIAGFSCEKGSVESQQAVSLLGKERRKLQRVFPNMIHYEARHLFRFHPGFKPLPEAQAPTWKERLLRSPDKSFLRSSAANNIHRTELRIGIPRALNQYSIAPLLRSYLEVLGLKKQNIIFSDETSEELWQAGSKFGSIDPCFPSKVATAHVVNLLTQHHQRKPLHAIWFPSLTHLPSFVSHTMDTTTCPIVAGTPNVVKAAMTKEHNQFQQAGINYIDQPIDLNNQQLLEQQLWQSWGTTLRITKDENRWAMQQALITQQTFDAVIQKKGREILEWAEQNNEVVLLLLARPYHADPGLNHEILEEFQSLGYPILSIRSIPKEKDYLNRFFANDIANGLIEDEFDIRDVWPENYSTNSVQKVWAAKFAARHPNVAVLDLSSFKCGHDAPTYGLIEKIIHNSKTPYAALHDIDANKPSGSIKIRVKTYAYALQRFKEQLQNPHHNEHENIVTSLIERLPQPIKPPGNEQPIQFHKRKISGGTQ